MIFYFLVLFKKEAKTRSNSHQEMLPIKDLSNSNWQWNRFFGKAFNFDGFLLMITAQGIDLMLADNLGKFAQATMVLFFSA
jgi:hypothetical protein